MGRYLAIRLSELDLLLARFPLDVASAEDSNDQVVPPFRQAPGFPVRRPLAETSPVKHELFPSTSANQCKLLVLASPSSPPRWSWSGDFAVHATKPRFHSPVALSGGVLTRAAVQRSELLTLCRFGNGADAVCLSALSRVRPLLPLVKDAARFRTERLDCLRPLDSSGPLAFRSPRRLFRSAYRVRLPRTKGAGAGNSESVGRGPRTPQSCNRTTIQTRLRRGSRPSMRARACRARTRVWSRQTRG
jgi:hypothetical protein